MPRSTRNMLVLLLLVASTSSTVLAGKRYESETRLDESLGPARALAIHNLLGSVEIRPTVKTDEASLTLRVVAEAKDASLARKLGESVQLVAERSDEGLIFHVVYPEVHSRFHPPRSEAGNLVAGWVGKWLDKSTLTVPYGDRNVEVGSGGDAALVTAHVTIDLPIDVFCKVEQVAGNVDVHDWRGVADLSVVEGRITVERFFGTLHARATGGSVMVQDFRGDAVDVRNGSGSAKLKSIHAERVAVHSTSGGIEVEGLQAATATVRSGSGEVYFKDVEPTSLDVSSNSGNVLLASLLERIESATIDAPDSEVTLRLGEASYDLRADTRNGVVETRAVEVERIGHEGRAAHLRHGAEGGADLRVVARKLVLKAHDARWIKTMTDRDRMH